MIFVPLQHCGSGRERELKQHPSPLVLLLYVGEYTSHQSPVTAVKSSKMGDRVTRSGRQAPEQQEQQARARWTMALTKILVDLMVEQVEKGNRKNNSFGKKAWRYMCVEFYKKTGLRWDKEQLKNRYAVLRRLYGTVKLILDRDEFTWDESSGIVIANDEAWAEYIRGCPDAEPIKTSGCPIYKDLCTIFSEQITTNGDLTHSTEHLNGAHSSVPYLDPTTIKHEQSSSSESEEPDDQDYCYQQPSGMTRNNRKRGRMGVDDAIARAILDMAAASKLRTAALQHCKGRYGIEECIKELDRVQEGLEEEVYFAALELFNKPYAREMFLSLKHDKRLTWLRGKCVSNRSVLET